MLHRSKSIWLFLVALAQRFALRPWLVAAAVIALVSVAALHGRHVWQVYTTYYDQPADWKTWRVFNERLDHNDWFFRADRQDFAAWLAAQEAPLLIPLEELQRITTRTWPLPAFPDVTTADSAYTLPENTQLVIPWSLERGGLITDPRDYAVLHGSKVVLLPPPAPAAHAQLIDGIENAPPIRRDTGRITLLGYTRPLPPGFTLAYESLGGEHPLASFGGDELRLLRWHGPTTLTAGEPAASP